jgi:hypothetical protein
VFTKVSTFIRVYFLPSTDSFLSLKDQIEKQEDMEIIEGNTREMMRKL